MAKKAKWLEESTNQELLSEVLEKLLLGEDIEKRDITRATKAIEELQERLPQEGEEVTLEEALEDIEKSVLEGVQKVRDAYESELEAMEDEEEYEDDEEEEEEDFEEEDFEDDEEDEEEEEDYESWTVKELRAECRERGIAVKGLKKPDMIEALQELDEEEYDEDEYDEEDIEEDDYDEEDYDEEDEDDEEEIDYQDLPARALKELMRDRGIKVKKGMKKKDLINALEADDQE